MLCKIGMLWKSLAAGVAPFAVLRMTPYENFAAMVRNTLRDECREFHPQNDGRLDAFGDLSLIVLLTL